MKALRLGSPSLSKSVSRAGPGLRQPCCVLRESRTGAAAPPFPFAGNACSAAAITTSAARKARKPDMSDYSQWTKTALVSRIQHLESLMKDLDGTSALQLSDPRPGAPLPSPSRQPPETTATGTELPPGTAATPTDAAEEPPKKKAKNTFDPSRYATRPIVLKIAYLGKRYGGFEFQPSGQLSTIEEELWKALVKTCLVSPAPGTSADVFSLYEHDYSKCGRTDRGVSAFGQVVTLSVRSNLRRDPDPDPEAPPPPLSAFPPPDQEIAYCKTINRILPPDIRVMAWCPAPFPDFSARFSCRERRYRYFFTQPAYFGSTARGGRGSNGGGGGSGDENERNWLDIDAMRKAAQHYVGLHDFRNFCKIDPTKQITNFMRRIYSADIVEVDDVGSSLTCFKDSADGAGKGAPKVYSFDVRGSAFLWHQIRHMVAVLFLVGQGWEDPSVVPTLLDVAQYPRRPNYTLADDTPLVLWDCLFYGHEGARPNYDDADAEAAAAKLQDPASVVDELDWIYAGEELPRTRGFSDGVWATWHEAKVDEILANRLLDILTGGRPLNDSASQRKRPEGMTGMVLSPPPPRGKSIGYEGGDGPRVWGNYVPLLRRQMLASPEEANDRYAQLKGFADAKTMRDVGNWRSVIKARKLEAKEGGAVDQEMVDGP